MFFSDKKSKLNDQSRVTWTRKTLKIFSEGHSNKFSVPVFDRECFPLSSFTVQRFHSKQHLNLFMLKFE